MPDRGSLVDQLVVDVERRPEYRAATVRVRGELDMASTVALQHELEALLGEDEESLVLDLTEVPFCDVPVLNLLLRTERRLRSRGGALTVVAACRPLRIMISALGLDDQLPLATAVADAGDRSACPQAG
jgi:anti-sigma B factor antagonist